MDCEDFYEGMKNALKALGIDWGKKMDVEVSIFGDRIYFSHQDEEFSFKIDQKAENK